MKFLLITKPLAWGANLLNIEQVRAKQVHLRDMEAQGALDRAYVKIGGGAIYILNANSFSDLRTAFRESPLALHNDFEIYEIQEQL